MTNINDTWADQITDDLDWLNTHTELGKKVDGSLHSDRECGRHQPGLGHLLQHLQKDIGQDSGRPVLRAEERGPKTVDFGSPKM